ncbi:MAG: hypothetical protein COY53_07305 [Elusimicrobia bacterium CG_4_10_14_0_8_um_filter_37_32]|nr:MAG: hypothetical protein COY53_07305 [Elusimicrobia bacterium CG_4_10_14_0_8_um_filter_37_32]
MVKKILLAEDEWELRNLMKLLLEDYDFEILEAEDGEQTINIAKGQKPDLIMLDNNMPGLTGYEVIQKLKVMPEVKSIPIIMLTGKQFDEEMKMMIKMDVKEFLPKPYEEDKIIAAVKNVFGEMPKKIAPVPEVTPPGSVAEAEIGIPPLEANMPEMSLPELGQAIPDFSVSDVLTEFPVPQSMPEPAQPVYEPVQQPEISPVPEEATIPSIEEVFATKLSSPVERVENETKFFIVSNISVKELIGKLCNLELQSRKSEFKQIIIISQGETVKPEYLDVIMDVFGSTSAIILVDAEKFAQKSKGLVASGAIIVELDPSSLRKI